MSSELKLIVSVYVLAITSCMVTAQAAASGESTDSCDSLTLTQNVNREETIRISRALHICDDLRKMFDRSQVPANTFAVEVEQNSEEHVLQPGEVDNLLQQPQGQSQLLRQLAAQVAQAQQERYALAEELQDRLGVEKMTAKVAGLASDSNRVRLQVQNVLMAQRVFEAETEMRRYQRTKFLNAFLGTSVSTVGTGLQFSDSLHVQHVGDALGVVGGGLTAFFNICTADCNVKDDNPDAIGMMFTAFATENREQLVPQDVWESLDPATKEKMKSIFTMNQGHTDLPFLHLSCHWGSGPHYKSDAKQIESLRALKELDKDLTKVNVAATMLLQEVALQ